MKRFLYFVLFFFDVSTSCMAFAQIPGDIIDYPRCKHCSMNRAHFAHSRTYIVYEDDTSFAGCSIHCAALELAVNTDKLPVSIKVADFDTHALIDADAAYWVIGGNRAGVMTLRAKWAFEKRENAARFMARDGGSPGTFDEVIEATYKDMYKDSKMIRTKRKIWKMHK